jgi:transposase InsO family protein
MVKRLIWALKDEEMNLREYRDPVEAQLSLERFRHTYNFVRPHQALRYRVPADLFCAKSADSA